MDRCFSAVHRWFTHNGLSLNPDKSEIIIISTNARHRHEGAIGTVQLVGAIFAFLNPFIPWSGQHVDNICRTSFCHIRALRRIKKLVTTAYLKTVATAIVSTRLDYCKALLYGTSASNIKKLQRVQNTLACLITSSSSRCHVTPILADLHWLPVYSRMECKDALLAFKTMTTQRPTYFQELIQQPENLGLFQ